MILQLHFSNSGCSPGHVAQFRRADGREILGTREQDGAAVADPFVEIDHALRSFQL
jgi:hypothetical protein